MNPKAQRIQREINAAFGNLFTVYAPNVNLVMEKGQVVYQKAGDAKKQQGGAA